MDVRKIEKVELHCHLRSLKEQNVIYIEIMLTSFLSQCESMEEQLALYEPFKAMVEEYKENSLKSSFALKKRKI